MKWRGWTRAGWRRMRRGWTATVIYPWQYLVAWDPNTAAYWEPISRERRIYRS